MFYDDFNVSVPTTAKSPANKTPPKIIVTPQEQVPTASELQLRNQAQEWEQLKTELRQAVHELKSECTEIRRSISQFSLNSISRSLISIDESDNNNYPSLNSMSTFGDLTNLNSEFQSLKSELGEARSVIQKVEQNFKSELQETHSKIEELQQQQQTRFGSFSSFSGSNTDPTRPSRLEFVVGKSPTPPPKDIVPRKMTEEEHQRALSVRVDSTTVQQQMALDGSSLQGKTIDEISSTIPGYVNSCAIQLTNLMDLALTDLQMCDHGGIQSAASRIPALTIEALTFGTEKGHNSWGTFTYLIEKTDLRFVVYYSAFSNICIALAPADIPVDHSLCNYMSKWDSSDWDSRPDKRGAHCTGKDNSLSVSLQNFIARVTRRGRGQVTMKIEILRSNLVTSVLRNEVLMNSLLIKSSSYSHLEDDYGYILEITNLLDVQLHDPRYCLEDPETSTTIPPCVNPYDEERILFKIDSIDDMILAYKIGATDLSIAVVFGNDHQFALAILPSSVSVDSALMSAMSDSLQWQTRPDLKLGYADEGMATAHVRNFRAQAQLTSREHVPTLKLELLALVSVKEENAE